MQIVPKVPLKIYLIISIFIYRINNGTHSNWIIVSNRAEYDLKQRGTLGALVRFFCIMYIVKTVILMLSFLRIWFGVRTDHVLNKNVSEIDQ